MNNFVNKGLKILTIISSALGFAALATPASAIIAVNVWTETGDASNSTSDPQLTQGNGPLGSITGDIGGDDTGDIFAIRFLGGDFDASVRFDDDELAETDPLILELFSADGASLGSASASLFFEGLAAGVYHLGVFTGFEVDPPFTITFDGPNVAFLNPLTSDVPEPVTLSLLGAGIVGIGAVRRRNARK